MSTSANPWLRQERSAMAAPRSAEEFLDGGSSVAAKWPKEGFKVEGDIIGWSPDAIQQTDVKSGEPLFWEGKKKVEASKLQFPDTSRQNPCLQMTMDLQCEPTGVTWESNRYIKKNLPDDDGIRTMYVHGQLAKAIRKARQDAAVKYKLGVRLAPLETGVHLVVTRGQDQKFANDYFGFTYTAEWTPAAHNPNYQDAQMDATEGPWESGSQAEGEEPPF